MEPSALPDPTFRLTANPKRRDAARSELDAEQGSDITPPALLEIRTWPDYRPTPLVELAGLARAISVDRLWYKDEGHRFGLRSFKPVGGGYAVSKLLRRIVREATGEATMNAADLAAGRCRDITSRVTVACATDGNHGRAVAWAASTFGCHSVIYLASHVSPAREQAIAALGAEVVRTTGNHDQANDECARDAERNAWYVISETSRATTPQIARDVLDGYQSVLAEVATQLPSGVAPTHVVVQAGVGGLAAASAAYSSRRWPTPRPRVVVVEAETADSLFRSIEAGQRVTVTGALDTLMAGLAAGEVSEPAWQVLEHRCDYCMTIPDAAAVATMRILANPAHGDPPIVGGESGVASLAAVLAAARATPGRRELGIDDASRIVVMGTEGATDESVYQRLVGRPSASVVAPRR
jgi:diaminopropionate ammonia-lyase